MNDNLQPDLWGRRERGSTLAATAIASAITIVLVLGAASVLPHEVAWSDQAEAGTALPSRAAAALVPVRPAAARSKGAGPAAVPAAASAPATPAGLSAPGVVRSRDQAVLASRLTALITAMPFEPGQTFGKGQLLVSFDCSQLRAQLKAADAAAVAYRTTYDTDAELDQYKAIGRNEVSVAHANMNKASAEADAVRASIAQCTIAAPFAGAVVEKQAHRHDIAASGQPLMTIQKTGDLEVELIVPSGWLTWVRPGTPFDFALEETGGIVSGHVVRLGASVDPVSRTVRVTGAIAVRGTVLPGMSGVARFHRPDADARRQVAQGRTDVHRS